MIKKISLILCLLVSGCAHQMAEKCSRWSYVDVTYELKPGYVVMKREYRCTKFKAVP